MTMNLDPRLRLLIFSLFCVVPMAVLRDLPAQTLPPTGAQHLVFSGLRSVWAKGQFRGVKVDAGGDLYLLLDQGDGIRLLKTDAGATMVLAEARVGSAGDVGLALALDPAGSVYVTGTTTSGSLATTSGAAFGTAVDSTTNSFVAKFDPALNLVFVTLAGGTRIAPAGIDASSDAVFITGSLFAATLPVTPGGIQQSPANGSTQNGFVEKFSSDGSTLLYATYLTGAGGNTAPSGIVVDDLDNAYVAGYTTAPGYPTLGALVPTMIGSTSGFLTKLNAKGSAISFSTYVPGSGITSLAIDRALKNVLVSGNVALGSFPIANAPMPLVNAEYQVLVRMPLDGSTVLSSTVLAPGPQSTVSAAPGGAAWVAGQLDGPLLPRSALSTIGNAFALRVTPVGMVDQTARFGGAPATNPMYGTAPATLSSLAVDAAGEPILAGSIRPAVSADLAPGQTYDLPLYNAPTGALPSALRDAAPTSCPGSLCTGSAALLAKIDAAVAAPSLALSVDAAPLLTLRNLGSVAATGLQIGVSGFSQSNTCGATLAAGGECSVGLTGTGPGKVTVQAANAASQSATLAAIAAGSGGGLLAFSPKELDFGVQTAGSPAVTRTVTVTNLGTQSENFATAQAGITGRGRFFESASDCTPGGTAGSKLIAPGGSCRITLAFAVDSGSNSSAGVDGFVQSVWVVGTIGIIGTNGTMGAIGSAGTIGTGGVILTGFSQGAAVSLSASEIAFGTRFVGGLQTSRFLYLSNNSGEAVAHVTVNLPPGSPFTVSDRCPSTLEPHTICQIQIDYSGLHAPAADSMTLALDDGLSVLLSGETRPQQGVSGASVNPNLLVTPATLNFANPVVVTGVSSGTQTATLRNLGAVAFPLSIALTGDFTETTDCGATLAGGASCSVVVALAPSQPGSREGLLSVTTGSGTAPAYVALTGTGVPMVAANNGTLDFGEVPVGQPAVRWYKITQPFSRLAVVSSDPRFGIVLVEDIGYGHGQPASSAFSTAVAGSCINCYLGIQFKATAIGPQTGTLSISSASGGNAYALALTGDGLPLTGLILSPTSEDFGPVAVGSVGAPGLFTLTNLLSSDSAVSVGTPVASGDFVLSNDATGGAACGGTLMPNASCFLQVGFAPTVTGQRTGTLTVPTSAGGVSAILNGFGAADGGLALNPTALVFSNLPGPMSTQQTIAVTNTSQSALQIGTPATSSGSFQTITNCGVLAPGGTCTVTVSFRAGSAPVDDMLQIPAGSPGLPDTTAYSVPLTGAYTTEDAGLQILPNEVNFGPGMVDAPGGTREFTINNLTGKPVTLAIAIPRQFVLAGPPCAGLAPYASCSFAVTFLPLTNGDITGTLFAQGTPTDGSATLNGLGYLEGFGSGENGLAVSGDLLPGNVVDFGQVASGQWAQRVLTITNQGGSTTSPDITVRRVVSGWPFLSTTNCGGTLAVGQSCTVTLAYTPLNQVGGAGSAPTTRDTGTLVIESDALSSPELIDLTGRSTPVVLASPSNTAPLVAFEASQSSLTFETTSLGSVSAQQTITLANTGTATIHISGVSSSADFLSSSTCGVLVPSASCTVSVSFVPQSAGARISAVEIVSDASSSLDFVSVIGVGIPSSLQLTPRALDFGDVKVGLTASVPLQVTNGGASAVVFKGLSASGDYSVSGGCPGPGGSLAAGAGCTLQVIFAPSAGGVRAGTLSVASSATALPISAALTGVGVQAHLQMEPGSLAFGSVGLGGAQSLSLTLANGGSSDITGVAVTATGDFAVTSPCGLATLHGGSSCSVTVSFNPVATGARAGTLTVTSSDVGSPATAALSGTGVMGGGFVLTVDGGASSRVTVSSGAPASYALQVSPQNGFAGPVVFNCTPINAGPYANCSLLPSSVTLNGSAQSARVTINTVTTVAGAGAGEGLDQRLRGTFLCLLAPTLFLSWKARTSRRQLWRTTLPVAWVVLGCLGAVFAVGCGAGGDPNLRKTPGGTYRYQVTASSTAGAPASQTVTLDLVVQ